MIGNGRACYVVMLFIEEMVGYGVQTEHSTYNNEQARLTSRPIFGPPSNCLGLVIEYWLLTSSNRLFYKVESSIQLKVAKGISQIIPELSNEIRERNRMDFSEQTCLLC
jgi:hypothetical protein